MIAVYLPNERGVRRSWRDATHRRLISSTRRWQKHNCQNAESTAKHIWAVNTWHSYRSSHGGGQTCPSNGCLRVSWRHLSALLPFLDFRSSKSDTENQTVFCNLLWGALSSNLRFQGASLRLRLTKISNGLAAESPFLQMSPPVTGIIFRLKLCSGQTLAPSCHPSKCVSSGARRARGTSRQPLDGGVKSQWQALYPTQDIVGSFPKIHPLNEVESCVHSPTAPALAPASPCRAACNDLGNAAWDICLTDQATRGRSSFPLKRSAPYVAAQEQNRGPMKARETRAPTSVKNSWFCSTPTVHRLLEQPNVISTVFMVILPKCVLLSCSLRRTWWIYDSVCGSVSEWLCVSVFAWTCVCHCGSSL